MKFGSIPVVISTAKDRVSWRVESYLNKPFFDRKYSENPLEVINYLNAVDESTLREIKKECDINNFPAKIHEALIRNKLYIDPFNDDTEDLNKHLISWTQILELIYLLVRIKKPKIVVETGVGEIGASSAYILKALEDNKKGELYSIDPDKFYQVYGYHIGRGIPDELRYRHHIIYGKSQDCLESTLEKLDKIDIFLHDGEHKFKTKLFEYTTVKQYLIENGYLLSDDTNDSAFDIFLKENSSFKGTSLKYGDSEFFSIAKKVS